MGVRVMLSLAVLIAAHSGAQAAPGIRHYVYFNREREQIADERFLNASVFEGAQLKYAWSELEPEKDHYNIGIVLRDLEFLQSKGKKLFIQVQDSSFDPSILNIPDYIRSDPEYAGGAAMQYAFSDGETDADAQPRGWVARRWDPAVRARFQALLRALGSRLDGQIEGVNLPETAIDFGATGRYWPEGFSPEAYRDSVLDTMKALKDAFPKSVAIQYANFMPGEWRPWNDRGYLAAVYAFARRNGIGVGGPDILPYKKGQMNHSYPLIRDSAGAVPLGAAVQWGNYEHIHPETGQRISIADIYKFAREYLRLDYVFWCTQEPYFECDVIPFLQQAM